MDLGGLATLFQQPPSGGTADPDLMQRLIDGIMSTPEQEAEAMKAPSMADILKGLQFSVDAGKFKMNVGGKGAAGGKGAVSGGSAVLAQLLQALLNNKQKEQRSLAAGPGPSHSSSQRLSEGWRPPWSQPAPGGSVGI